jgi:hypothetical protein
MSANAIDLAGRRAILSVARWPEVYVFDRGSDSLLTLDFASGTLAHRLRLGGGERDGADADRPPRPGPPRAGSCKGTVEETQIVYLPMQGSPGPIKPIDLAGGGPAIASISGAEFDGLNPFIAAASSGIGRLFVAVARPPHAPGTGPASSQIQCISLGNMEAAGMIGVDSQVIWMDLSPDGKFLYCVSQVPAVLSVVDTRTLEVVREHRALAGWPAQFLPLRD